MNIPTKLESVPGFNPLLVGGEPYFVSTQEVLPDSSTHYEAQLHQRDNSIIAALQWASNTVLNNKISPAIHQAHYTAYAIYSRLPRELATDLIRRNIIIANGEGLGTEDEDHWWTVRGPSGHSYSPGEVRLQQALLEQEDLDALVAHTQFFTADEPRRLSSHLENVWQYVEQVEISFLHTRDAFIKAMFQTINVEELAMLIQRPLL